MFPFWTIIHNYISSPKILSNYIHTPFISQLPFSSLRMEYLVNDDQFYYRRSHEWYLLKSIPNLVFIKIEKLEKLGRTLYKYLVKSLKDSRKEGLITVQIGWDLSSNIVSMWSSLDSQAPLFMVSTENTPQWWFPCANGRRWLI